MKQMSLDEKVARTIAGMSAVVALHEEGRHEEAEQLSKQITQLLDNEQSNENTSDNHFSARGNT